MSITFEAGDDRTDPRKEICFGYKSFLVILVKNEI